MKIAAISDIHGNIYALMKALEDIDEQKVDKIICLGDFVGYGPHPNEVIALIKRREIPCIKGNYDASVVNGAYTYIRNTTINSFSLPWTCSELRTSNKFYLDSLPEKLKYTVNGVNLCFTHGSPNLINEYLFENEENTKNVMLNLEEDILVCAHTHIPSVKSFNDKLFINCGSVGKPKIGVPDSTYCLLEINKNGMVKAEIKYASYGVHKVIKDMEMLKFPSHLIQSFKDGIE